MGRRAWVIGLGLVLGLSGTAVQADEPSTAGMKAEIEVLKDRLSNLEGRLASAERSGISSTGEKPTGALVELPSGLQGLGISGYADVSYVYNFAEPDPGSGSRISRGRVFDTEPNGFTPHAFEIVFEKPMTDAMPVGFRADLLAGDDADIIGATGLTDPSDPDTAFIDVENDQIDLQQAYVTARAPVGAGIDFKVGKFVTLLGAEVIESPANWNFSRSYMFGYAIPFTHTGVLASYPLGEMGSVTAGVVNGWDIVDDDNKAKSLLGNITLTPMTDVTLGINGITGAEVTGDNRNDRTVLDLVGTWKPMEDLTLMANYDFGHQSLGSAFDGREWTGLALYAKYDLSPTWALASRLEWFDDKDGFRLGLTGPGGSTDTLTDVDFYGTTLTSQWTLHEHVLARLEYRHDKADEKVFFHDADGFTNYQDTIAAEMIYHF